jgi:predicted dehydrogenase
MHSGRIRLGVIGTSWYAQTHIARLAKSPSADLVAIAGRDVTKAHGVAAEHGFGHVFGDYRDLIESKLVDAVVIVAPDDLHEEISLAAFASGLHVLCEKPLSTTAASARRMAQAAASGRLVNMSYFGLRFDRHHQYLRQLVADDYVGQVREAELSLSHGFFKHDAYNWRFDAARGGGVIADLGCYLFDQARWYVGEMSSVTASGRSFESRPHPAGHHYAPAHDSATGLMTFASGAHASFAMSVIADPGPGLQKNRVVLQGSHARIELEHDFIGATLVGRRGKTEETLSIPARFTPRDGDLEFLRAIATSSTATPDFEDGWRVQRCVDAAITSTRTRSWVHIEEETL